MGGAVNTLNYAVEGPRERAHQVRDLVRSHLDWRARVVRRRQPFQALLGHGCLLDRRGDRTNAVDTGLATIGRRERILDDLYYSVGDGRVGNISKHARWCVLPRLPCGGFPS